MAKKTPASTKSANKKAAKGTRSDTMRETVESIVVAFVLAFLFRTFEAEAFVIPTGSMAPTLLGRHKDVHCDKCGLEFEVGASDELDDDGLLKPHFRVKFARCPNCRFENDVIDLPVFKGDRILVNKFPYEFGDPERWDVVVFKYPEGPATNYIKRLVGLPGELIKVNGGDLYLRDRQTGKISILRKDNPNKQRELQLLVYDNNHSPKELHAAGWPQRWQPVKRSNPEGAWNGDDDGWESVADTNAFRLSAQNSRRWLRYHHIVPQPSDWKALANGKQIEVPQPQPVRDYCSYNTFTHVNPDEQHYDYGSKWVGDLTLNCTVQIKEIGDDSELLLELVEGQRWYRCRINPQTGDAKLAFIDRLLSRDDEVPDSEQDMEQSVGEASTELKGTGEYEISFANVDDRLCLWINDSLVEFEGSGEYAPAALNEESEADGIPIGVAASGLDLQVSDLLVQRDICYRSDLADPSFSQLKEPKPFEDHSELASEQGWFELQEDEFLVLGDNSPRSKDSRLWGNTRRAERRHAVPRSALIGKAFFIYWPHGIPFLNDSQGFATAYHHDGTGETDYPSFRVPFYPQVWRMQRIR